MRRRETVRRGTLTAAELVDAVAAAGLDATMRDPAAVDELVGFLHQLGGYDPIDYLQARCIVRAAQAGAAPPRGLSWDDR